MDSEFQMSHRIEKKWIPDSRFGISIVRSWKKKQIPNSRRKKKRIPDSEKKQICRFKCFKCQQKGIPNSKCHTEFKRKKWIPDSKFWNFKSRQLEEKNRFRIPGEKNEQIPDSNKKGFVNSNVKKNLRRNGFRIPNVTLKSERKKRIPDSNFWNFQS